MKNYGLEGVAIGGNVAGAEISDAPGPDLDRRSQ